MEIRTHFHSFNLAPCCVAFRSQISTHFGCEKCSRLLRMSQIEWWPLTVLIISTNKWLFDLHLSCFFLSSALLFWRQRDSQSVTAGRPPSPWWASGASGSRPPWPRRSSRPYSAIYQYLHLSKYSIFRKNHIGDIGVTLFVFRSYQQS